MLKPLCDARSLGNCIVAIEPVQHYRDARIAGWLTWKWEFDDDRCRDGQIRARLTSKQADVSPTIGQSALKLFF